MSEPAESNFMKNALDVGNKKSGAGNSILNYFRPVKPSGSSNIQIVVPEHKRPEAVKPFQSASLSSSENSCPNSGSSSSSTTDGGDGSKNAVKDKNANKIVSEPPKDSPICIEIDEMSSLINVDESSQSSEDDFVISLVNDAIEGDESLSLKTTSKVPTINCVSKPKAFVGAEKPKKSKSLVKKDGTTKSAPAAKVVKKDANTAKPAAKKKTDNTSSIVDLMMGKTSKSVVAEKPVITLLPDMGLENFKPLRLAYSESEIGDEQLVDCLMIHQFIVRFGETVFELNRTQQLSFALFLKFMVQRKVDTVSDVACMNILHDLLLFVLDENAPEVSLSTVEAMMAMFLHDKQHKEFSRKFIGVDFKSLPFQLKIDACKILVNELLDGEEFRDFMKDVFIKITDARAEIGQLRKEELQLKADEPQMKFQAKNLETRVTLCEKERDAFVAKIEKKIDAEMAPLYKQLEVDERPRKRELELKKMRDDLFAKHKSQIKEKDRYLADLCSQRNKAESDHKKNIQRTQQITTTLIKEQETLIKQLSEDVRGNEFEELGRDPWERRFYLYQHIGCILVEPLGTHNDLPKQWQCIHSKEQLNKYIGIMKTSVRFLPHETRNMLAVLNSDRIQNVFTTYNDFIADVCVNTDLILSIGGDDSQPVTKSDDSVIALEILEDMREMFTDCCEKIDIVWKYAKAEKIDYGTNDLIFSFRVDEQLGVIDAAETVEQFKDIVKHWLAIFEPRFYEFKSECILCKLLVGQDTCAPSTEKAFWIKSVENCTSRAYISTFVLHLIEHVEIYLDRLKCRFGKAILVEAMSKPVKPAVNEKIKSDVKKRSLRSRKSAVTYSEETSDEEKEVKPSKSRKAPEPERRSRRLARNDDASDEVAFEHDSSSESESENEEKDIKPVNTKKKAPENRGTRKSKRIVDNDDDSETDDENSNDSRSLRKRTRPSVVDSSTDSE